MNLSKKISKIEQMAKQEGWSLQQWKEDIGMLSFVKPDGKGSRVRINVYVTKMTVGTCLNHPVKGKTQMFRKNVDDKLLQSIFKNPRLHTDKGYMRKNNGL